MSNSICVRTFWLNDGMLADVAAAASIVAGRKDLSLDIGPLRFGQDFDAQQCGCIVTALDSTGSATTELLDRIARSWSPLVVVCLAEKPTTRAIVDVIRQGAFDVLDWPSDVDRLDVVIEQGLATSHKNERRLNEVRRMRQRLGTLTPAEVEVMKLMLDGHVNKTIARRLSIALRTVEARRKRVFEKLETRNLAEIAGLLNRIEMIGRSL